MSPESTPFEPKTGDDFNTLLASKTIFVVGAGGIGCELLKNLALTGFRQIHVIDLDTIDVSNLNRQFLFHKVHVGQPKAKVASDAVKGMCPAVDITSYHDSIFNRDFNVAFFQQFDLVLNALDNRAARVHVNRMCLVAKVPLIESGSAGYLGQVTVIQKGVSECYECMPKPTQRTFPGCTIRNTPSEPIHCIVWAKHLFNQLFGECDIDEDVAPDVADPELSTDTAAAESNQTSANGQPSANGAGDSAAAAAAPKFSTRKWAAENKYDAQMIFTKLFNTDIAYLLSMDKLWKKRRPPVPLDWNSVPDQNAGSSRVEESAGSHAAQLHDQVVWTPEKCRQIFASTVDLLAARLAADGNKDLVWDKDDDTAMDFVAAVANIRSHIFGIALKSRWDIKSMAGNIVPAIASTNAIVAGLIVVEALKIVHNRSDRCRSVFITRQPNPRGKILVDQQLEKPNPKCFVCAENAEVFVKLNCHKLTVATLEQHVLKQSLSMVAPDVSIMDNNGTILISSEPGETDGLSGKTLSELNVVDGSRLMCDDFELRMEFTLVVQHTDEPLADNHEFEIVASADVSQLQASAAEQQLPADDASAATGPATTAASAPKRKLSDAAPEVEVVQKKGRISNAADIDDDEIECID